MNKGQTRIVVIEDQIMLRDLVTSLASSLPGVTVVGEAVDGREGLRLCEDEKPDLAIFDLFLPSLNGSEILRQFGKKYPKTRFIAISANFTPDSIRELLELGCHGIIAKSSSASKLTEGFKEVSEGGSYLCPMAASLLRESHISRSQTGHRKGRLSNREREVLQAVVSKGRDLFLSQKTASYGCMASGNSLEQVSRAKITNLRTVLKFLLRNLRV